LTMHTILKASREAVLSKLESLQMFFLYLLVAFLPVSNAIVELSATVIILVWIVTSLQRKTMPRSNPLFLPLGIFLLVCAASLLWTTDIKITLSALFYKWCEYILLFFAVADLLQKKRIRLINLVWVFIAAASLIAFDGITQYFNHRDLIRDYALYANRITASFTNPNDLAGYIATALVLAVTLAIFIKRTLFERIFLLCGITPLFLVCMVMTGSRGAWIGAVLGVATVVVVTRKKIAFVLIALVLLSALVMPYVVSARHHGVFSSNDISVQARKLMWESSFNMFKAKPFLGHGLGTFMENYPNYRLRGYEIVYAHNCYLQIATETGIFSLLLFLWALYAFYARAWIVLRKAGKDLYYKAMVLAAIASFQVSAFQSFVDTNLYALRMAVLFWLMLAMATGGLMSRSLHTADDETTTS